MATIGRYSRAKLQKIISGSAGGGGSGDGDVTGAASSTDNAVVRFNGTGGKTIQNSAVIIDDSNNVTGIVDLTTSGDITVGGNDIKSNGGTTVMSLSSANASFAGSVSIADDQKINFGTNNDAYIEYDENGGDYLSISGSANGLVLSGSTVKVDGDLYVDKIRRATDSGTTTKILLNDEVLKLYAGHSSNEVVNIANATVTISADVSIPDDKKIYFGDSNEGYIEYNEDLDDYLTMSGSNIVFSGSNVVAFGELTTTGDFTVGGNDIKSSGGTTAVTLNGANTTFAGNISLADDKKIYFGDSNEGHIEYNEDLDDFLTISGSNVVLSGSSVVASGEITGSSNFLLGTGASNTFTIDSTGNVSGSGTAQFQSALTASSILVSGGMIRPSEPGGTKLGSPAYEFAEAYFADDKKVYFGSNQDAYIYYDEAVSDYCIISGSANGLVLSGSTVKVDGTLVGGSPLKIGGEGMEFQAGSKLKFPASTALSFSGSYIAVKDDVPVYFGTDHDSYIKFVDSTGQYMEISGSSNGVSISGSHVQIDQTLGVALNGGTITHGITLPNSTTNNSGSIIAHSYATYSSHRYKKKVEIIKDPLEKIKNIQGVSFSWKDTNKKDIGFIAEEVGKIIPEVVNFDQNGQDAMSMDYTRITAILVEGMKEQQVQLDQQKKYILQLQKIIEELKNNF
jgi:hypothetical protein